MAAELELKARIADPAAVRARLLAAGATPGYCGFMVDRRFDRNGELTARDEVLRLRSYDNTDDGDTERRAVLAWKGPTRRSAEGYKLREELECRIAEGADAAPAILGALGFAVAHTVERRVEHYDLDGATVRLEWYPRMDVLVEVEGSPAAIERAVAATGIPRTEFTAEPLVEFVGRYERRTGRRAALAVAELGGEPPSWSAE